MGKKSDERVKSFVEIIKRKFDIDRIIFFGSRARGKFKRNSDYDFIIVSKDFNGIKFTDRISKIYPYWKYNYSIEPLCYTPEEFNKMKMQITIVREAVKYGVVVL